MKKALDKGGPSESEDEAPARAWSARPAMLQHIEVL